MPESVVTETVFNHEREHIRATKAAVKSLKELRRVAGRNSLPADEQLTVTVDYRATLEEKLENLGIEVEPVPIAATAELVERAARRTPPFDENGNGFRDTLTWLVCREAASNGVSVFLVSPDSDFGGREGVLKPSLADEVSHLAGSVTIVTKLGPWLMEHIPWSKDKAAGLPDAAALARDEEIASLFAPWDMFEDPRFSEAELGLPPSAAIEECYYAGSGGMWIDRKSHTKIADGKWKIVYEFPIDFDVEFQVDADEAFEAGYVDDPGNSHQRILVSRTIEMIGEMTVIHDEQDLQGGLTWFYDSFEFRPVAPTEPWAYGARSPQEPPGTPTLFDDV